MRDQDKYLSRRVDYEVYPQHKEGKVYLAED